MKSPPAQHSRLFGYIYIYMDARDWGEVSTQTWPIFWVYGYQGLGCGLPQAQIMTVEEKTMHECL